MFCQNCGSEVTGSFCPNCGTKVGAAPSASSTTAVQTPVENEEEVVLWEGQPAGIVGKLKSSAKVNSATYKITNQRIIIEAGVIDKVHEEIELGRIKDYQVSQKLAEKLQNIGDVIILSTDSTCPAVMFENVENPVEVKEKIRSAVMKYRKTMNISYEDSI